MAGGSTAVVARSKALTQSDLVNFKKIDTNHNGLLDRLEAARGKITTSVFNKMDINPKTGKVSFNEYDAYYHKIYGLA